MSHFSSVPVIMSIYEKTSILGLRMSQLSNGAQTTLTAKELETCQNVKEIARLELNKRKIPLKLVRENVSYSVSDLIIP